MSDRALSNDRIVVPPPRRLGKILGIGSVILIILASAVFARFNVIEVLLGLQRGGRILSRMFPLPGWFGPLMETLQMAVTGTFWGALFAFPIAVLSARNVVDIPWLRIPLRFLLNILRTIPAMVFAAMFVAIFGIGNFSGVIALTIFSFGLVAKLLFESIEAIDEGQVEALKSLGADTLTLIRYAVVPQILPQYVSYTLYAFEINVRSAAVLGYVGAGGIGQLFEQALAWRRFHEVGELIIVSFVVVLALDFFSAKVRRSLI